MDGKEKKEKFLRFRNTRIFTSERRAEKKDSQKCVKIEGIFVPQKKKPQSENL